ncbi:MAG: protein meaA [Acidimicrobiaceae bacterium]|nr:protein meaA [Acidimicrobiaceae bacterium]
MSDLGDQVKSARFSEPDAPWVMRTYSGHSSAKASNQLYRLNLEKGQTGLSIAFDLPTQIGFDPDDFQARGEVGKVGVPIVHLGDIEELFDGIPIEKMNTSMTINATAAWLLGLYIALARKRGLDERVLSGTTQNDIIKEYLSRGTFIFPPEASKRLIVDTITYTVGRVPKWNPINICSYHLQEAGATPVQEVAYALATAVGVLDAVKESKRIPESEFPLVVGRISFFVNAGIRFIEENAKMRAFNVMWDQICQERYQVTDEKLRRFRYGVQVNSLGLTEQQPENNVPRIVLESLGVLLSRDARARALQLPAWNEALGLPRPWDQQWSLRIQQILALETDLLDYPDIFEGSIVMDSLVKEIVQGATVELEEILSAGGVFSFIDELKSRLVRSQSERTSKIEKGELAVVGVNRFVNTEPSPLSESKLGTHLVIDPKVEAEMVEATKAWRLKRNSGEVEDKLDALKAAAKSDDNLMEATIQLALVGGTTGEWARALREVFGEYRAPTGVSGGFGQREAILRDLASSARSLDGGPPRLLVAKPGLDGHSNGAEQIAVAARDAGFEVIYQGIRLTPHQIAVAARDEDVDLVGISILSGSHLELVPQIIAELAEQGSEALVVVGGIIPEADQKVLIEAGVARIYTPKDYEISQIMHDLLELTVRQRAQISNV